MAIRAKKTLIRKAPAKAPKGPRKIGMAAISTNLLVKDLRPKDADLSTEEPSRRFVRRGGQVLVRWQEVTRHITSCLQSGNGDPQSRGQLLERRVVAVSRTGHSPHSTERDYRLRQSTRHFPQRTL